MNNQDPRLKLRKALSEGVSSWLTFEQHCGRAGLFSERYLALPIAQILTNHFGGNVEAEHTHPVLKKINQRGRPPQIDFIVRKNNINLVVESKWIGTSTVKVEDVIWDCIRLELAAHHYSCDGLFILAGKKRSIDEALQSAAFNPETSRGNPSRVLGFNGIGRHSVNVQSPTKDFGPVIHEYINKYPHVKFPRSFVCGNGLQINKHANSDTYITVVWHIKPEVKKRFTFTSSIT